MNVFEKPIIEIIRLDGDMITASGSCSDMSGGGSSETTLGENV